MESSNSKNHSLIVQKTNKNPANKKIVFSDKDKFEKAVDDQNVNIQNSIDKIGEIEEELKKLKLLQKEMAKQGGINNTDKKTKKTTKKVAKPKIPEEQKHTIIAHQNFEIDYDYDQRRKEWHLLAGHNEKQLVCDFCKDDDNWETILLDNGKHVCYYCWIKKPENLKNKKKTSSSPNKPRIPENQKHCIVDHNYFNNEYDYDRRRVEWHEKAGHNEKQLVCDFCKDDDNWETILLDNGKHVCYYCWIKKPENLEDKNTKPSKKKPLPLPNKVKSNSLVSRPVKPKIPEDQKHSLVTEWEFENEYSYDQRRTDWHKKAGHNSRQMICDYCKDDDNWETILLDNDKHVCYYCWIKKPENLKNKKKSTSKNLVVKKTSSRVVPEKKKEVDYEKIYPIELDTLRTAFQVLPRPIQKEYEKKIYRMIDRLIELKFIEKRH